MQSYQVLGLRKSSSAAERASLFPGQRPWNKGTTGIHYLYHSTSPHNFHYTDKLPSMVTSLDYELAFFGEVYSKGEAITDTWAICRARVGRGERWERDVSTFREWVPLPLPGCLSPVKRWVPGEQRVLGKESLHKLTLYLHGNPVQ